MTHLRRMAVGLLFMLTVVLFVVYILVLALVLQSLSANWWAWPLLVLLLSPGVYLLGWLVLQ